MFGKKKPVPQIDKEQLALIKNAERRIKQKKRLYIHFVIFLIGAVFLIIANTVLEIGTDFRPFGIDWFVYAILIWLFLFIYHFINVFLTHKFMGKAWEQSQLDGLVAKQKERIQELEKKVAAQHPLPEISSQPSVEKKTVPINGLTMIVAAGENDSIGKDNELIWHLSDDLKRFKRLTSGHHIIMGRKTFETFPQPLPNRSHIVITRQQNYQVPNGVLVVHNLEDALDAARLDNQPFIIGGGEIYKQAMPYAKRLEITRVHSTFDGDTFFPKISSMNWKEVENVYHPKDAHHDHAFSFITYERV